MILKESKLHGKIAKNYKTFSNFKNAIKVA